MKLEELVIAELKSNPMREGRTPRLSDELIALCAVLDRKLKGIMFIPCPPRHAEGSGRGPTAKTTGKK